MQGMLKLYKTQLGAITAIFIIFLKPGLSHLPFP